jgi:hypothetical protein
MQFDIELNAIYDISGTLRATFLYWKILPLYTVTVHTYVYHSYTLA